MPVEKWSDSIVVVHLADDPQFSDDIEAVERLGPPTCSGVGCSAVLDFAAVHFLNSSNLASLLRLRRHLEQRQAKMIVCNIANTVWGTLLLTGLDKILQISENVPTALATLQVEESA
jgi:anti-anti-sigma factor